MMELCFLRCLLFNPIFFVPLRGHTLVYCRHRFLSAVSDFLARSRTGTKGNTTQEHWFVYAQLCEIYSPRKETDG